VLIKSQHEGIVPNPTPAFKKQNITDLSLYITPFKIARKQSARVMKKIHKDTPETNKRDP